ncbi:MAG: aminoglycoside phosphotransferase family protein [Eubacteriales bacterium]|nr:aminoglycoside phosphotransferase family protein [Eubacteriales bacterium]
MELDRIIAVRNNKTIYRDGDRVYKVFDRNYSKADVLNEALNQARVEETGLCIPKILEVMMIDGKWTIVSEYIEGKTLSRLMKENPEKKDEYIEMLADLQLQVHLKKCGELLRLKDKMNRKICDTELPATVRYGLHARLEELPVHDKLCHGDFYPSNIIIKPDGTPCFIDWAHATQGSASADAAKTFLLFRLHGDIEGADKYLDLFCEKSDTEKEYVHKWIPIVAASLIVKGNEAEREFFQKCVDAFDY